jgi:hypothetical protein
MKNKIFCFLLLILLIPAPAESSRITTRMLIRAFRKNIALENEFIKRNVFTLVSFDKQFVSFGQSGWSHKFILKDSLGDLWIFKPNDEAIKSVNVYQLYKLFGAPSPATFKVILPVNGKMETGTVQELIKNAANLKKVDPAVLSWPVLQQILKFHVLDWLVSDYDCVGENFLLTEDKIADNPELFRVDTDVAFVTFGLDFLKPDYSPPWYVNPAESYYYLIFKNYLDNRIILDFRPAYKLAAFICAFPDSEIMAILNDSIKTSFCNERKEIFKTLSAYKKAVNLRKRNLNGDFRKFYTDLGEKKGHKIFLTDEPDNSELERIYRKLEEDSNDLRRKIRALKVLKVGRQEEIKVIASYRVWKLLQDFTVVYRYEFVRKYKDVLLKLSVDEGLQMYDDRLNKKFFAPEVFNPFIEKLKEIRKKATGENERKAVDWYIEQLFEIKNSGRNLTAIKRIIKPPVENSR